MKSKKREIELLLTFLTIFIISITSCSDNISTTNEIINNLLAFEDLNKSLQLSDQSPFCGVAHDNFCIGIQNTSKDYIDFPVDWGVKIFIKKSNSSDWIEIKNDVKYHPSNNGTNPYLNPKSNTIDQNIIVIHPIIPNSNNISTIRIIVEGNAHSTNSGTNHPAAAYIDISVKP